MKRPEQDMIARSIATRLVGEIVSVYWCPKCEKVWDMTDSQVSVQDVCTWECKKCQMGDLDASKRRERIWSHDTNVYWKINV